MTNQERHTPAERAAIKEARTTYGTSHLALSNSSDRPFVLLDVRGGISHQFPSELEGGRLDLPYGTHALIADMTRTENGLILVQYFEHVSADSPVRIRVCAFGPFHVKVTPHYPEGFFKMRQGIKNTLSVDHPNTITIGNLKISAVTDRR